jgi:hypothetical protein
MRAPPMCLLPCRMPEWMPIKGFRAWGLPWLSARLAKLATTHASSFSARVMPLRSCHQVHIA